MTTVNPSRNMEFACYALALAKAGGSHVVAAGIVADMRNFERVQLALKAAVPLGTSASSEYAQLVSYQTVASGFVESLRATSVLDAILPACRRIPLRSALAIVTSVASAGRLAPGGAKILTKLALQAGALDPVDVAALIVVTEDLLRFSTSAGLQLLDRELQAGVSAACNREFLAGMADGVSALASTGSVLGDLRQMLAAVNLVGVGRFYVVASASIANEIATLPASSGDELPAFPGMSPSGGQIQNIPVLVAADDEMPSDSSGPFDLMLIEASQIAAQAEAPRLSSSKYASVQMDDDPSLPGSLTSMFQTHSVVLRAERSIGFEKLRSTAVAAVSGASYGVQS